MKLVWSQPSPTDRPRTLLLLGVVCIFFGGIVVGRPGGSEIPRPFRAAAASLVGTGLLVFIAGGAALAFQKRRTGTTLTLAEPLRPSPDADPGAGLREEEQR